MLCIHVMFAFAKTPCSALQVYLSGKPVSSIVSQTSTQVIVVAPPLSGSMSLFEAEIRSASFGVGQSSAGSFYYAITGGTLVCQQEWNICLLTRVL